MCIIVDNNVVRRVLVVDDDPDLGGLHDCLVGAKLPRVRMVYCRELLREYGGNRDVLRIVLALDRAGRARAAPETAVRAEEARLRSQGTLRSNDYHIVALARTTGVRLLCSDDGDLWKDFNDKALLDHPRGKVYTRRRHRGLLVEACGHL